MNFTPNRYVNQFNHIFKCSPVVTGFSFDVQVPLINRTFSAKVENCTFRNQTFVNCTFQDGEFKDVLFANCTFCNCTIDHVSFDKCVFGNCSLVKCDFSTCSFSDLVIEGYSTFVGNTTKDVVGLTLFDGIDVQGALNYNSEYRLLLSYKDDNTYADTFIENLASKITDATQLHEIALLFNISKACNELSTSN